MKLIDLSGNEITIRLNSTKYSLHRNDRSKLQTETANFLREKYPHDCILEDFTIPNSHLSVDFFLPSRKFVIEVDGSAHHKFIGHFHGQISEHKFARQIDNDSVKSLWCELNAFKLIRVITLDDLKTI